MSPALNWESAGNTLRCVVSSLFQSVIGNWLHFITEKTLIKCLSKGSISGRTHKRCTYGVNAWCIGTMFVTNSSRSVKSVKSVNLSESCQCQCQSVVVWDFLLALAGVHVAENLAQCHDGVQFDAT